MLDRCKTAKERFLTSLMIDLDSAPIPLASLNLSGIDALNSVLRLFQDDRNRELRLSSRTIRLFNEYASTRTDKETGLFLGEDLLRQSDQALADLAYEIGARAGLVFQRENFRFVISGTKEASGRIVAKGASRNLFYLYGMISNPVRRRIIDLLGDEGPLGFTQIRTRLSIPVGTLYYNFDMLKGLVVQQSDKKYKLTETGQDAYRKVHSSEYAKSGERLADNLPEAQSYIEKIGRILLPSQVIRSIQSTSLEGVLGMILILALGSLLIYSARLETFVFFLNPSPLSLYLTPTLESLVLELAFLGSWLLIYLVSDIFATMLYGRRGEHFPLLVGTAYCLLPIVVFASYWEIIQNLALSGSGGLVISVSRILAVVVQAWSLALLARIISSLKGIRLDKAAIISLTLAYVSIMIAFVQGI